MPIVPRTQVPDLAVDLVGGERWSMADSRPENFTVVFFYRGYH